MTTIAFRDGVLAADTATTFGQVVIRDDAAPKIVARRDCAAGAVGDASWCARFLRAFLMPPFDLRPDYDRMPLPPSDQDEAVIIDFAGTIVVFDSKGFYPSKPKRYYALGSGAAFALGAMFHGATAVEAVEAGIEHDPYSGGEVTVLRLGG